MSLSDITYRPLKLTDADALANILGETWHMDVDGEIRHLHGLIDLAIYAQQPTWTQVAEMDGRPVGVIMARAGEPDAALAEQWRPIEQDAWASLRELPDGKADELQAFFDGLDEIDAQLLEESGCDSTYELVMFAVSAETRGRGVGGTLLSAAQDYLRAQGATEAFFYTDTDCNWQYYEHRGMKRAAEHVVQPEDGPSSMMSAEMYLYLMDL